MLNLFFLVEKDSIYKVERVRVFQRSLLQNSQRDVLKVEGPRSCPKDSCGVHMKGRRGLGELEFVK